MEKSSRVRRPRHSFNKSKCDVCGNGGKSRIRVKERGGKCHWWHGSSDDIREASELICR